MTSSTDDPTKQREQRWQRHRERLDALTEQHPLRYLFLEVTRRCNLKCAYCGSSCTAAEQNRELSIDEWLQVVAQIASDFDARSIMVAVTGGEPLIKKGIFELFAELHARGFAYGMVTNGFLLDDAAARRLIEVGIGSISVSMDAPGPINDELRGQGACKHVEQAIAALQAAGFKGKLEIISTITKPVVPLLVQMREYVARLRVPNWRIAPVMPIGRAASRPDLIPAALEIRQMLEFVRAARADKLLPRPEFCEEGFVGERFEGVVRPYLSQCRAGITIGSVLHDGRIGACPELGEAFVQGDIRTERFKDVWEQRYQDLRQRFWTYRDDCAVCEHYGKCNGGSLHLYADKHAPLLRCLYRMARQAEQ